MKWIYITSTTPHAFYLTRDLINLKCIKVKISESLCLLRPELARLVCTVAAILLDMH